MNAEEIAATLVARAATSGSNVQLAPQQLPLALDIIAALKRRVDAEKLRNSQRALQIADVATVAARQSGAATVWALAQWARGNALYHLSRYQEALACYREAQAIYVSLSDTISVLSLQINQVAVLQDMSNFQAALDLAEQARATCLRLGTGARRYLASLEMNAGAAYRQIGAPEAALAAYERGRALFVALHEEVETARIDINRANVLQEMGRFDEAEALFANARAILAASHRDQEVARADHNRGKLAYRRGHYQAALHFLEAAYSGFAAIPNPVEMATVNLYRAQIYRDLNMPQETITLATEAEQAFQRGNSTWLRAVALTNQGIGYQRLGAYARAAELLQRARRLYRRQGARTRVLLLDVERAYLAWEEGAVDRAQRMARRLLHSIDPHSWPELALRVQVLLARCRIRQGDYEAAARYAATACELGASYCLPGRVIAFHLAGAVAEGQGDNAGAWQNYTQALHTLEALRATLPLDEFQLGLLDDKQAVYADMIRLGQEFAGPAERLALINMAYASPVSWLGLVKTPAAPAADDFHAPIPTQLQHLREQWHWHQSMLESAADLPADHAGTNAAESAEALRSQLRAIETQMADLLHRWRVRSSSASANGTAWRRMGSDDLLAALQQRLAPEDLLLIYHVIDDQLAVALLGSDMLHMIDRLTPLAPMQRLLRSWRFQIEHGDSGAGIHSTRFYAALLAPLEAYLAGRRRIQLVLPAGWQDLPFAVMSDGQQPLIERFEFSYYAAPDGLLRPTEPAVPEQASRALVVGCSDQGRLPHALTEASQVAQTLASTMPTHCLLEEAASMAALREELGHSRLLHLATHATFRPDNPLFSWIRLADGRLTVADLYTISLPGRPLVVLSACETGRGQPRGGGLLGMGRGFLAAGAAGIVVSLWKIEDQAAAQLMTDFYTVLQSSATLDPAAALRQAQRQARLRGKTPRDWASFMFIRG